MSSCVAFHGLSICPADTAGGPTPLPTPARTHHQPTALGQPAAHCLPTPSATRRATPSPAATRTPTHTAGAAAAQAAGGHRHQQRRGPMRAGGYEKQVPVRRPVRARWVPGRHRIPRCGAHGGPTEPVDIWVQTQHPPAHPTHRHSTPRSRWTRRPSRPMAPHRYSSQCSLSSSPRQCTHNGCEPRRQRCRLRLRDLRAQRAARNVGRSSRKLKADRDC